MRAIAPVKFALSSHSAKMIVDLDSSSPQETVKVLKIEEESKSIPTVTLVFSPSLFFFLYL